MNRVDDRSVFFIAMIFVFGFGLVGAPKVKAAEIFSDTFDATPDWQNDGSQRCSYFGWDEAANDDSCAKLPLNYDFIYVTDRNPNLPMCEINSGAARGSGKGLRVYDESNGTSSSWGSDCQLAKYFTTQYRELWASFYIRYNPAMIWSGGIPSSKIFRIGHYNPLVVDGTAGTSVFNTNNNSDGNKGLGPTTSGVLFLNVNQDRGPERMQLKQSVRCAPQYKCGAYKQSWWNYFSGTPGISWPETVGDNQWHHVEVRVVMNSAPGVGDGIVEVYFDGVLQTQQTDVPWRMSGVDPAIVQGFNLFTIAGNSNNVWAGDTDTEQWMYDVDDVKICTARCGEPYPTLAAPMISPESGEYSSAQGITVDISAAPGATIYYTTDGRIPDPNDASQQYAGEFTLFNDTRVSAIAVQEGYSDSDVSVVDYMFVDNLAPRVLGVEDKTVTEGSVLSFLLTVDDPDTGPGRLEASGIPFSQYQATLELANGVYRFDWNVPIGIAGDYVIDLTAIDGRDATLTTADALTITVTQATVPTRMPKLLPETVGSKGEVHGSMTETLAYDSGTTGDDRALVAAIGYEQLDGIIVSRVTYNGVDMTPVHRTDAAGGSVTDENVETWILVDPSPGVNDLVITFSGDPTDWAITAATYHDVDPNAPVGVSHGIAGDSDPGNIDETVRLAVGHGNSRIITAGVLDGTTDRPLDPAANDTLVVNGEAFEPRSANRGLVMGLFSQPATVPGDYETGFNADPTKPMAWAISAFELRGVSEPDSDLDGMPDAWEIAYGLDPAVNDAALDLDGDGLENLREFMLGTLPNNSDSDGDGMPDGWEVGFGLNPLDAQDAALDLDGDGVSNLDEFLAGTDPTTGSQPPVADAGADQSVFLGDTVALDAGNSRDPDNHPQPLTYRWTFSVLPSDSLLTDSDIQNGDAAMASFVPDTRGVYALSVRVSDGEASDSDLVSVRVLNNVPLADAGPDQNVGASGTVVLDGSGSTDADGDVLTYRWQVVGAPEGSTVTTAALQDAAMSSPRFVPDVGGDYIVELVVNDSYDDSAADRVVITATVAAAPSLVSGTVHSKGEANGQTTEVLSYDSGASGVNRALVVALGYEQVGGVTVSRVTYNGVDMARVLRTDAVGSWTADENLETWVLVDPSPGVHDLVITFSDDPHDWAVTAATYEHVHQNTPIGASQGRAGHSDQGGLDETVTLATAQLDSRVVTVGILDGTTDRPLDPAANDTLVVNVEAQDQRSELRGFVMGLFSQSADVPGAYVTGFNADPAREMAWAVQAVELRGVSH